MKRTFLLIFALLCCLAGIFFAERLPADTTQLVEEKYDTWAGVIRVWACEELGAAGWLNACASMVEKELDGVYINVQEVSADTLGAYAESGVNPPDIIIYPAGLEPDAQLLAPIAAAYPLRDGLRQGAYSVPVLLEPRFWIYDASAYETLPGDMYEVAAACREEDLGALVALGTGLRAIQGEAAALPGLDLGLDGEAEATPPPAGEIACRVSPDIIIGNQPRQLFLSGEVDAFVGGIADILYMAEKSEWAAAVTGKYAWAAELVMCSIVNKDDGRGEACMAYLDALMGEGQALAARAQAFPAVSGASAWSGNYSIAPLEAALEGRIWAYGEGDAAAHLYIEGKISADEAAERIVGGSE